MSPRLGFMKGRIRILDDVTLMDAGEIEELFLDVKTHET